VVLEYQPALIVNELESYTVSKMRNVIGSLRMSVRN
jgi:hypothetical protein